jgi:methylenetetrahydrofolate dehydrogenase (NADP+)/methenyltetrahydrofolate cyclohydrolase
MTATLINGTEISKAIQAEVEAEVATLKKQGIHPGLAVVLVGADPASASYVGMKARMCEKLGIFSRKLELGSDTSTEQLLGEIDELNNDDAIDGILIQLPLPTGIDKHAILEAVDPVKDADGFHSANIGSLVLGHESIVACTPSGVMEMLRRSGVEMEGKRAVVLGRSDDVGKPMAMLLMHANATVTICHSRTRDLASITREADILVAAIGRKYLVRKEFLKPGAVVIDVGANQITDRGEVIELFGADSPRVGTFDKAGYIWVGDVHEREALEVASMLSPVPGGAGPMTIAILMQNTVKGARMRRGLG